MIEEKKNKNKKKTFISRFILPRVKGHPLYVVVHGLFHSFRVILLCFVATVVAFRKIFTPVPLSLLRQPVRGYRRNSFFTDKLILGARLRVLRQVLVASRCHWNLHLDVVNRFSSSSRYQW